MGEELVSLSSIFRGLLVSTSGARVSQGLQCRIRESPSSAAAVDVIFREGKQKVQADSDSELTRVMGDELR